MSYLVLARKWRPQGFDDLIGQEPIIRILKNAIDQGKIAHAYLFSGPRGVGKTSAARILAKALNCQEGPTASPCGKCESCRAISEGSSVDVSEIDGASNNSVDDIRDLRERVKYAPSGGKYKVYIIDEVHMLSTSAFNALLKTLEEPPSHVIFVLATTEMKKIPATVLSRCQQMPFRRMQSSAIKARLKQIAESEGIIVSPAAIGLIARAADGSVRDSLTILDQLSSFTAEISEEQVKNMLGITGTDVITGISRAIIQGDRAAILEGINSLAEHGVDFRSFTKELVQFFRDLLVAGVLKHPEDLLDVSSEEMSAIREILAASGEDVLTLMLAEIVRAESDVRNASFPRLALEMALLKTSFLSSMQPISDILRHLDQYRTGGQEGKAQSAPSASTKKPYPRKSEPAEDRVRPGPEESGEEVRKQESPSVDVRDVPAGEASGSSGRGLELAWEKTLERIEAPLASKLLQTSLELNGDELTLVLNGGHAVFEDAITKGKKSIEKILSEEYGSRLLVRLKVMHKKPTGKKDLREKALEEPVIKEALELFEGRIVDVIPIENAEQKNGGSHV